jgi:hypothetical protein
MTSSESRRDGRVEGEKNKEKESDEISASEEEVEVVQAQQPLSVNDLEMGKEKLDDAGAEGGSVGNVDGLPFSKARCIALVATVTGAAFLNVRPFKFFYSIGVEWSWRSCCVKNYT